MSRHAEPPCGFQCPYRHSCPHLDGLSTTWALEVFDECSQLRGQYEAMEAAYEQRIAELEKALLERDDKIAQLQVQHRKLFKPNKPNKPDAKAGDAGSGPVKVKVRRRGAPLGHPGWRRRVPDHVDETVEVDAPKDCPHCHCTDLMPHPEAHEHLQEDIILVPRTRVTRFVHRQSMCPQCRRPVYQAAPGELPGCSIGPVTRAVAMHLRYDLQIPSRKVQHVLSDLFGMPLVPATAMAFDRRATELGGPLYEQLKAILKSSAVAYADETTWRQDGQGYYVWFGGNEQVAVYQITDNHSAKNATELLGEQFDGTLVSDDYAVYDAVDAKFRQTCWNHLRTKSKEVLQQIELATASANASEIASANAKASANAATAATAATRAAPTTPAKPAKGAGAQPAKAGKAKGVAPANAAALRLAESARFCRELDRFAVRMCALGRRMRAGKLSLRKAKAMIPSLRRQLRRFAGKPLDHPAAETLRQRVMVKDRDKLFTFLKVKGVQPTNNHAERALRFLVIMRKICFGTRSDAGSESHGVLPSLLQTAKQQGTEAIAFLTTLLTKPLAAAKAVLFGGGGPSGAGPPGRTRARPSPT